MSCFAWVLSAVVLSANSPELPDEAPVKTDLEARNGALRLVVYPVRSEGLSSRQQELFGQRLVRELNKVDATSAVSWKDGLERAVPPEGCDVDRSCLARIAKAFGADLVITARVNRVHSTEVLTLKALDLEHANVEATTTKSVEASEGALSILGDTVEELFPARAIRKLATRGVPDAVSQRWSPKPISKPIFFAGVAATLGVVAGAVTSGVLSGNTEAELNHLLQASSGGTPVSGARVVSLRHESQRQALIANALYGVGGALAAATLIMGFFTDWGNDDGIWNVAVAPSEGQATLGLRW